MTEQELDAAAERSYNARVHIVEYMRDHNLTPSEGISAVIGLLISMYTAIAKDPSEEEFTNAMRASYLVHMEAVMKQAQEETKQ